MSVEREMSLAEWCAKLPSLHLVNQELSTLNIQLAALAEQNEKMSSTLSFLARGMQTGHVVARAFIDFSDPNAMQLEIRHPVQLVEECLSLPDLATPVLNKYRAEGMRMAARLFDPHMEYFGDRIVELINSEADELEKANG